MQTNLPFFKKLLAVVLFFVAISCCSAFAVSVTAEESTSTPQTAAATNDYTVLDKGTCGTNLTWQLTSDYTLTISGTGKMNSYFSSTRPWQKYANTIKKIVISAGVSSIGDSAFRDCNNLTSVTLPDSVTYIDDCAFFGCPSLTSINIPDTVTEIGDRAFTSCKSLTTIIIPNGITSINDYTFQNCISLTSVVIPNSVTKIGSYAFAGCKGLKAVYITDIGAWCNITFSDIDSNPLNYANKLYINNELLTQLIIPNGITTIKRFAFCYCSNLTSVTIPDNVTSIEGDAFSGCYKLIEVINYSGLNIKKGSSDYGYAGYYALNVKQSGTTDIINKDGYLFYTYDNVNYLVNYIGTNTDLVLPDNYNDRSYQINNYAFYDCDEITSVVIPNSVTSIDNFAFRLCSNLTSMVIGNGITSIGNYVFDGCYKLVEVINYSSLNITKGSSDYGFVGKYALNVKQSGISDIVNKDDYLFLSVDNVNYLINYIGTDTDLILPDSYNDQTYEINNEAFWNCSGLTSVVIPDSVTTIGDSAFKMCSSLTSIVLPSNITKINSGTFERCSKLTSINIPNNVTSIGSYAFDYCELLTNINIPDKVTEIGSGAFYYCSALTSINIPKNITSIGNYAFQYCSSLSSINIPNSVTSIGNYAFYNCDNLTDIFIYSPQVEIYNDSSTFPKQAVIHGYLNSTAQEYATKYNRKFIAIECEECLFEEQSKTEPTCTQDGKVIKVCKVCGKTIEEPLAALGHAKNTFTALKEATCTEDGKLGYYFCSVCNSYLDENENVIGNNTEADLIIPAKGHSKSDWITDENATCTKDGKKHMECTVCNETLENATIDKLGHDEVYHEAKAPTCTEIGWNEYFTCGRAGCDYTTYVEITELGHDEVYHEAKVPTCTEIGWNEYYTCNRDDCAYTTYVEQPAKRHSKSDWIIDENATCTKDGNTYTPFFNYCSPFYPKLYK